MRLLGKVAVITGAVSGMGLAMAKIFTAQGASVVAADWNGQRLNEVVASLKANGAAITGVQGNIADQATAPRQMAGGRRKECRVLNAECRNKTRASQFSAF